MPPLPRLRVTALGELAKQLRFAPREALLRDIERAEALAGEIDPGRVYPEDWIVFRITGYRAHIDEPAQVVGAALLGDLSALVERLTAAAGLTAEDLAAAGAIDADALAARWGVSRKTLERWRREGLLARRASLGGGLSRLAYMPGAVERFERANAARIARAAAFSRVPREVEAEMLRRAARYRDSLGLSLNETAGRLARRFGRSHEGVRRILRRHDQRASAAGRTPIFGEPPPLAGRRQRIALRAWRRGVEPGRIAARFGRTRGAIHHALLAERVRLLRAHPIGPVPPSAAALTDEALGALLEPEPVRSGLTWRGEMDLLAFIRSSRERAAPVAVEERMRAMAMHALRARAARFTASLASSAPDAAGVDRAETDLRWAARLLATLVRTHLPLMVETLEGAIGVPLEGLRPAESRPLIASALGAAASGVLAHDPWRGGRAAAPVGLAVTRLAAERARSVRPDPRRATPRLSEGVAFDDWTRRLAPWQAFLEPDARFAGAMDRLDAAHRMTLCARFGLGGDRPRTLAELAAELGVTIMRAGDLERRAVRAALAVVRAE
ncbi:MAG: hypothetical protein KJZ54_04635 [Phycisphaerales bacterium]|nr:hypothetical protein [Phycisphaerales bacterium]